MSTGTYGAQIQQSSKPRSVSNSVKSAKLYTVHLFLILTILVRGFRHCSEVIDYGPNIGPELSCFVLLNPKSLPVDLVPRAVINERRISP